MRQSADGEISRERAEEGEGKGAADYRQFQFQEKHGEIGLKVA
jgi:hypothetical protein